MRTSVLPFWLRHPAWFMLKMSVMTAEEDGIGDDPLSEHGKVESDLLLPGFEQTIRIGVDEFEDRKRERQLVSQGSQYVARQIVHTICRLRSSRAVSRLCRLLRFSSPDALLSSRCCGSSAS